jgi:hypothetical protein
MIGSSTMRRWVVSGSPSVAAALVDVPICNRICRVHGYDRKVELHEAIEGKTASVVEHLGHVIGYTTGIAQLAHIVGEAIADLVPLIGAAPEFGATRFLLPTRNHEVFTWCLNGGLKLVYQMTLITMGLYNEPNGA